MNYTMPPRSKPSDYAKAKITQDELISLQIANDANISASRKAIKMGIVPTLSIKESQSPDELLADDAAQEANARQNMLKLGFRDQEAASIVTNIRNDANLDFITLNANFPSIEADVKKRFNVKLLTPAFFLEYLKKYSEELLGAAGMRVFQPNNVGLNGLVNTVVELRQVLPDPAVIEYIRGAAQDSRIVGEEILNELERLKSLLPNTRDLQALANLAPVQQQRIINQLLVQFANMPSADELKALATNIKADQIDRQTFLNTVKALVDAIPRGNQPNIVQQAIGSSSSSIGTASSAATAPYNQQAEEERKEKAQLLTDTKTAQNTLDIRGDPRTLTTSQQAIYMRLAGITRVAPTKEQMSSITGDTMTTRESLGSAIALNTASLKQMKDTLRIYPELANNLINMADGSRVNYNDLTLTKPKSLKSQKVYWEDTNIRELFMTQFGRGIAKISPNIRIKVGRGISVKETPSYREYGKYAIHIPQLEQQDILNVKYKSLGQIPKFKPVPVSDIFRDFILDLVENGKPNIRVYSQIAPEERKLFEEMSIGAGVWNGFNLKRTTTSTDDEEAKRFELLKGEYMAGNNNPKVISELRRLVVKMISDGRIRKNQGIDLLMELSI